jgi:hypothetical protein
MKTCDHIDHVRTTGRCYICGDVVRHPGYTSDVEDDLAYHEDMFIVTLEAMVHNDLDRIVPKVD